MSFDVSSTGYKGFSETNPADQVTGNVEQPKQNDKCAGSKMASVVKGISAYCDGVNVQLAPPNLGNPAASDSGKTEKKDDGEKADKKDDEKSSGGMKMTVKGTDEGGDEKVEETKEADGAKKAEEPEKKDTPEKKSYDFTNMEPEEKKQKLKELAALGPAEAEQAACIAHNNGFKDVEDFIDTTYLNGSTSTKTQEQPVMKIAGPTAEEQMEADIKDDIKQKVSADIWEKAQTDPAGALIDAEDAGYTELAQRIEGLMYSQSLA